MPFLVKKTETRSSSPKAVMTYITIGALLTVWPAAWFFFLEPEGPAQRFLCAGFFLSGMVFLIIGTFMGIRNIPTKVEEQEVDKDNESHREQQAEPQPTFSKPNS